MISKGFAAFVISIWILSSNLFVEDNDIICSGDINFSCIVFDVCKHEIEDIIRYIKYMHIRQRDFIRQKLFNFIFLSYLIISLLILQ